MIPVDLITGFLGSGKTTFLKRYARYLTAQGQKIGILENDYGAVNVDMLLLQELEREGCGLDMVAGACDADCHKRRFKTKLIAMGMSSYDRVLIEPSGVFDVDEFFDVLYEEPLDRWYEIGSVIAVVDANLEDGLSESADYLLASQLANAGTVVLSKTQLATEAEKEATVRHMEQALLQVQCQKDLRGRLLEKDWDALTDSDFARVMRSGYDSQSFVKRGTTDDSGFRSLYFMNRSYTAEQLRQMAQAAFADARCGRVFRVKGFVREGDAWLELNATRQSTEIRPIAAGQDIVIVIGEQLNEEAVKAIFA
jgi:G3E family GTPase